MSITGLLIMVGVFIALMFVYRNADRFIKKMDPKTVKTINWAGFAIGVAGGIAWYLLHGAVYMFITLFGIVLYFIFYGYDKMEESEGKP